ncbi:hypothetical protein BH10CHL1_BH10CHL1_02590 [soil metagenome]
MLNTFTHGRAAVLCFGGWGLQVMLHLWPRLQAVQEQRTALGATGADFSRITSFTAVLPDAILDANNQAQFYLRQPRLEQILQPFYAEKLLAKLDRELPDAFDGQTAGMLTMAEKRAALLLRSAESVLKPLDYAGTGFSAGGIGLAPHVGRTDPHPNLVRRATRVDQFRTALKHAEHIARLLEIHLLDPIRQDNLVEDDPFVQTTLYVIAPLFEPLAAALIWPLVSQLMARVGHRQVAQVVALLGTGSYASDLTRSVEDASAFAALAELEILTGVRGDADAHGQAVLRTLVNSAAPQMAELVGQSLFDTVYLLDREKSNQGLAQDSHELAVMAANALEALTVASGNLLIQEQLGYGLHRGEVRPYSLIGAASDYVPLAQLMHAVNRQEESRLVRDWVLRNTDEEPSVPNPLLKTAIHTEPAQPHNPTLSELGLTQAEALNQLTLRMPDFQAKTAPKVVEELAIHEAFVLPKPIALDLRRVPAPHWGEAFQAHFAELDEYIKLAVGAEAVAEAWGTQAVATSHEWIIHEDDDRLLPRTVTRMHERVLEILAASPTGLTSAQNQVKRWLQETEQARQKVWSIATPNARQLAHAQRQLALRQWTANYTQAVLNTPTFLAIMLRTGIAILVVTIFSLGYLLVMQRAWDPVIDGLSLLGFAVGILVIGLVIYRTTRNRIRALRRERVTLAQLELTAQLQEKVVDGLVRGYDRLAQLLNTWSQMLTEAIGELNALSTPPAIPVVPPPGVPPITLYQPHLSQALWDRCMDYLRTQQDTQGQRSEERLGRMWGTAAWRNDMKRILSGNAPTNGQSPARTIAQFIRNTVRQSVAPVSIEQPGPEGSRVRAELIRNLAQDFSIEHLLWRNTEAEAEMARRLRALERGNRQSLLNDPKETLPHRRYVEVAWNRAKPAGNYDVADRLAVYGTTIDFAAVSGDVGSDLTRAMLDEFNLSLLPTDNPFSITFVRTVHGLGLDDLEAIKRYRAELEYLSPEERALILLIDDPNDTLYAIPTTANPRIPKTLQTGTTRAGADSYPKLANGAPDRY